MKSTSETRRLSFNKTLFLCTMMALKETARLHPLSIALQKLREKERDILERLESEKPGFLTKDDLMVKLEAIRIFKEEYGIV